MNLVFRIVALIRNVP